MSTFSEARTYPDLIECCHLVLDKCHEVDGKIAHFGDADARRLAIADVQKHVAGLLFSLKAVTKNRTQAEVQTLFGGSGVSARNAQSYTEDFWRFGLMDVTHFRIDSLFQVILNARNEYRSRSGFAGMLKQILGVCELKDRNRTEAVFLAATYIRNSFHNNGMHRGTPLEIKLQDLKFKFETNKAINCASFGHVLAVLLEVMECLEEMLLSPALAKLTGPIPDDWTLDLDHVAAIAAEEQ
jgi:hypothetical protein